mgnify:CR=1 FL=1
MHHSNTARRFTVTVRTEARQYCYVALARSSFDAHADAIDQFGPCRISVRPL